MHLRSHRFLLIVFTASIVAVTALASLPTFWTMENQADFLEGEVEGLSIASDGTISLAPDTRNLYEATDPFFWSLVSDRNGNLYAGSGNEGKVYRIDTSGDAKAVADTNELQVHGLAVDRQGNVFAGTSPRGAVYKISAEGARDIFFDPDDRYIWDLILDGTGNLLVATGDKGSVYRVTPGGQSEVIFASQETHLVCLATDSDGNIYAGSDSSGLVFKIERSGKASVLFDTPFQEVHSIVLDSRGNVYAAAINGERRAAPPPSGGELQPPSPATSQAPQAVGGVTESVTVTVSAALMPTVASGPSASTSGLKGAVYRISPQGSVERLWGSSEDTPLSLKLETDDRIMVGTGKDGRIFLVHQDKTSSLLARVEADQVTSIYSPDGRSTYFATANPARVYRLASERRTEGIYYSPVKDTNAVSSMGRIRWEARSPAGTGLSIQTRTGNSSRPDNTWSEWSAGYTISDGDQISSPGGRFLQWRAILRSTDGNGSPELHKVTSVYLQHNLSPSISKITLHPPGDTFQKPLIATGQAEIMGLDGSIETPEASSGFGQSSGTPTTPTAISPITYSRKFYKKGFQTVTWSANDPNDDKLSYGVFYRGENETLWKLLRDDVHESVIAWDTVAMPDGRYTLKIVASDRPSNPNDLSLTGEKESRSFKVDNTPPRVAGIQATPAQGGHQITFQAEDDSSAIKKVEYSVDSGKWHVVYPTDGIADSKQESFDFSMTGFSDGVHTLVVKVTDLLKNVATARVEIR